jgi:hypothetical protein
MPVNSLEQPQLQSAFLQITHVHKPGEVGNHHALQLVVVALEKFLSILGNYW